MASVRSFERVAGIASLVAAGVHGALAPTHFQEWWGYGTFFLVATAAQTVSGLALVLNALDGPRDRARRALYLATAIGNVLLVALYVATRTVGIPFAGPDAGLREEVSAPGAIAIACELIVVGALAWLLSRRDAIGSPSPGST